MNKNVQVAFTLRLLECNKMTNVNMLPSGLAPEALKRFRKNPFIGEIQILHKNLSQRFVQTTLALGSNMHSRPLLTARPSVFRIMSYLTSITLMLIGLDGAAVLCFIKTGGTFNDQPGPVTN